MPVSLKPQCGVYVLLTIPFALYGKQTDVSGFHERCPPAGLKIWSGPFCLIGELLLKAVVSSATKRIVFAGDVATLQARWADSQFPEVVSSNVHLSGSLWWSLIR